MMQADEPAIPSRLDDSLLEGEEEEDVDGDGRALSEPSHSKREGLTCREACFRARVRCQRIASPGDVVRYLVDHSAIIGFLAVLLSLGALLFFGTALIAHAAALTRPSQGRCFPTSPRL